MLTGMKDEVRLQDVHKVYRDSRGKNETVALKDVNMAVGRGEVVAVLGPSGCGKTTILNMIAGFDFPTEGAVRIDDLPVAGPDRDKGVVFQDLYLFNWLTVAENIGFGKKMQGLRRDAYSTNVEEFVQLVGLKGFEEHRPQQLSGGMRQRVALARVLINEPRILLLDEPFAALDAQTRLTMQVWFSSLMEKVGNCALFITHDIDEAIFVGDRVLVMSARPGEIIAEFEVGWPRPRPQSVLTSNEFTSIKQKCLQLMLPKNEISYHVSNSGACT